MAARIWLATSWTTGFRLIAFIGRFSTGRLDADASIRIFREYHFCGLTRPSTVRIMLQIESKIKDDERALRRRILTRRRSVVRCYNRVADSAGLAANLAKADRYLARFRAAPVPHVIAGRRVGSDGPTFDNLDPVDNTLLCRVAAGTRAEVASAADAADAAFPAWRAVEGAQRRKHSSRHRRSH